MQIFIMRHGEAVSMSGEDSLRPLTKQGMLETQKMGLCLASCQPKLMNVFVSPYIRAQQTCVNVTDALAKATLLNDSFLEVSPPETLDIITPSGDAAHVHDFIDGLLQQDDFDKDVNSSADNQAILFVSHMPFVSYLVGELTGATDMPIFSTGTIAIIDYDIKQMQGQLVTMLSPENVHT